MLNLMDPYPMKRYVSLTYTQVQLVLDAHDDKREQVMKRRLNLFTNAFLRMTFHEQPRDIRRATKKLDLSIDQTFIKPPTKKGYSKKKLAERVRHESAGTVEKLSPGPVDVFAGYYPRRASAPTCPRAARTPPARRTTRNIKTASTGDG